MPFEKVETQNVDFPALERAILRFWNNQHIFEKRKALNAGKPKWSFLDGPITANNPMGVHHAWNRTYKDVYNRYFAMTGHELRYQQGFDCQGLWVEVEVEKELKLGSKRDIENLVPGDREASIARFVQACKDRVNKFARMQTNQSIRLGYWMNWDVTDEDWAKSPDERKSYFTMSEENNYTIWQFLKKCHKRGLIYRGYDAMPWCGRCGVGISEQEKAEGYRLTEHKSVFVRFPLTDRPGEYLLIWTTTPWTLTSNVAAAVNPELTYLRVRLKGEVYYVAKGAFKLNRMEAGDNEEGEPGSQTTGKKPKKDWLDGVPHLKSIEQIFKEKAGKDGFEIIGEMKGSEMIGWGYTGPFDDLPAQNHPFGYPEEVAKVVENLKWAPAVTGSQSHRVISGGEAVTETEGTGIVHTAPGCGQIDFHWGKEQGLPPIAPLDDAGHFVKGFGELTGLNAVDPSTADRVFELLRQKNLLFATERYVHKYPHCWRCKTELLFRLVDEWFINMNWRNEIMDVVDQVTFLPESINGRAREKDWLRNMGDWMISKKRFWGLALPIWVDEQTGEFEVIGSREELKERAIEGWDKFEGNTPHRPWVDAVKIRNPRTGNLMSRVPDVGNPWLDAGIVAFSTMGWNTNRAYWEQWYPADFITESFPGQFRNWFYSLLAMSTMMSDGRPPFKTLLGFATVRDQYGKPMHKSDGNAIEFNEAANDGYELFHDIDLKQDSKIALKELPKGYISTREEQVTVKGEPRKRVYAKYKPIGADVIRWLYCRHNPAANLNFGPEPTDEVRRNFVIKLWNSYGFLCNYANPDGFDPTASPVPVKDRPDVDRWILSDLQALVTIAREAFENYNVMAFCLEAERFLDEKLSNWYIRVNRDRFWSRTAELDAAGLRDKQAAYQTLYTVLTTFCKLIAPCVPFLAETMWRNLRTAADSESVHLCEYPSADVSLVDEQLSRDMGVVLRVVSLSGAIRDRVKVKTRQPVAEMKVQPATDTERRAVERFADLIADQTNVKQLSLHDPVVGPLLTATAKLNMKTAGAKVGAHRKDVEAALQSANAAKLKDQLRGGPVELAGVSLDAADVAIEFSATPGWAGAEDRGTQVALDTRITDELKLEGLARDVIRQVQDTRRNAGLDLADKIVLSLAANGDLARAIAAHRPAIATATQAVEWSEAPLNGAAHTATVKVEGQELTISLRKV
jgi:isoleucyl-tRNA synthetase